MVIANELQTRYSQVTVYHKEGDPVILKAEDATDKCTDAISQLIIKHIDTKLGIKEDIPEEKKEPEKKESVKKEKETPF